MCQNMNAFYSPTKKQLFFLEKMYTTTAIDHKGEKPEVILSLNLVVPGHVLIPKVNFFLSVC